MDSEQAYMPTGALSKDFATFEKLNKELIEGMDSLINHLDPVLMKKQGLTEIRENVITDVLFLDELHARMSEVEMVTKLIKATISRLEI